jgi:hypothetical protein
VKGKFEVDKPAIMREAKRVKAQKRKDEAAQQEACSTKSLSGTQEGEGAH